MLDISDHTFILALTRIDRNLRPAVWTLECPNITVANILAEVLWTLRLSWAVLYTIYLSRFFFTIFAQIDLFQNAFIKFLFRLSRPMQYTILGFLPNIYGVDIGIWTMCFVFEEVDKFLNSIAVCVV